ncbi:YoaK family protein, partial [Nocardia abscessus]|uniref:YoaK family protein n=1 Tax=Nocardia abscessus TaxID=120957 RepID=UPI002456AE08
MPELEESRKEALFDSEARLSWVLAALAGLIGAAAFMHTAGYFVTFMTGNTERAVLGYFHDEPDMALAAAGLLMSFLSGVVVASWCRRRYWSGHPHGPTLLTTVCLALACVIDILEYQTTTEPIGLLPIMFVGVGVGGGHKRLVEKGGVWVAGRYFTGTRVKSRPPRRPRGIIPGARC